MELDKKVLTEKICTNDKIADIKYYLSHIYFLEDKIESLLSKNLEKQNPIEDLNDFDRQILSLDGEIGFDYNNLNNGNGYLSYEKKLLEADIRNLINEYLQYLSYLLVSIDNSIEKLKLKSNNFYSLYFSSKIHNIIDFKSTNFKYSNLDYYLKLKEDFKNLKDTCENNPYKIILNIYLYYIDIIKIYSYNILLQEDNIYNQANIIKSGLPISIDIFDMLIKWETHIEVKDSLSIYDLIKK